MAKLAQNSLDDYLAKYRLDPYAPPSFNGSAPSKRVRVERALRDGVPRPLYEFTAGQGRYALRRAMRRNPGRGRVLPDFMIIGAAKAGTTSLYWWLSDHPLVEPATRKEVHFFDYNHFRGRDWYRSHFPLERDRAAFAREHGRPPLTGEASASYLSHDWAPKRAAALLPNVKLVALFRDPVDRAYSQYQMSRREGVEEFPTFEEALARESERLAPEETRVLADPRYNSLALGAWSYLRRSRYDEHVARWLLYFPREQFLFLQAEGLFAQPHETLERVQSFLGLPPHRPEDLPRLKWAGAYDALAPETREHLTDYFRPHNQRLRELTGVDFDWPE
jgi:sulfotransferase family protein